MKQQREQIFIQSHYTYNISNGKITTLETVAKLTKFVPSIIYNENIVKFNWITINANSPENITVDEDFNGTDITSLLQFSIGNTVVKSIDFTNFDISNVLKFDTFCRGCTNLESCTFDKTYINKIFTSMPMMFYGCSKLKCIDLSMFYSYKLKYLQAEFNSCTSLEIIDISNIILSYRKYDSRISDHFLRCTSLKLLYYHDDENARLVLNDELKFKKILTMYKGRNCAINETYLGEFRDQDYALKSYVDELHAISSTTITHYSPIESSINTINDFVIGAPVYMTGKVYKHVDDEWKPSSESDTTDCICSVKTTGTWKEYVGICVRIDETNNCITFATHGDYMVKVEDSSCYPVGDEVFIDNADNKLKILTGETAITSKINRMTVGIITGIINESTLAVFRG